MDCKTLSDTRGLGKCAGTHFGSNTTASPFQEPLDSMHQAGGSMVVRGSQFHAEEQPAPWRSLSVVAYFVPDHEVGFLGFKEEDITAYLSEASATIAACLPRGKIPNLSTAADCISGQLASAFPQPRGVAISALTHSYCSSPQGRVVESLRLLSPIYQSTGCVGCLLGDARLLSGIELHIVILPHALL